MPRFHGHSIPLRLFTAPFRPPLPVLSPVEGSLPNGSLIAHRPVGTSRFSSSNQFSTTLICVGADSAPAGLTITNPLAIRRDIVIRRARGVAFVRSLNSTGDYGWEVSAASAGRGRLVRKLLLIPTVMP